MMVSTPKIDPVLDSDEPEEMLERRLIDTYWALCDLNKVATSTASPRHQVLIDKAKRIVGAVLAER
jgi:hypothetical protein